MSGLNSISTGGASLAAHADAINARALSDAQPIGASGAPVQTVDFAAMSPLEQGRVLRALDGVTGDRAVSNDLIAGRRTAPADEAGGHQCTVEVRYTPVALGANHAFIVTTDADSQRYYRGGPAANEGGSNSPSSGSSGSGNNADFDPRFGVYGPIVTEYGDYRPGTIDWTTEPSGQQTVDVFRGNCDAVDHDLARAMDDIEAAQINYMPLHQNSNSTVREGLERAGYPNVDPVVWAPAWNTQLPPR